MQKEGTNLSNELNKQDKITSEEVDMIMMDCQEKFAKDFNSFEKMDNVLNKILNEVNDLHS